MSTASHGLMSAGFPALLLLFGIAIAAYASYLPPATGWVLAVFPEQRASPFLAAAPYAAAIAGENKPLNAIIAYVPDLEKRRALEAQTRFLIDPAGVPLCKPR